MKVKLAAVLFVTFSLSAQATEVLHQERSLYQNVYVVEEDGLRCLRFRKRNIENFSQSCVNLSDPDELVFDYYKQAMSATFFVDQVSDILIIGLGGGILAGVFESIYPAARITAVEIDPVVVRMARRYFDYHDDTPAMTTQTKDGRVFVKRAQKKAGKYDLIVLDAFTSDYIPEHLMTREFLLEVKSLLSDGGIVVANTFSSSKLFDHESTTYQEVFGEFYQVRFAGQDVSRVIIASNNPLPKIPTLLKRVNQMSGILLPLGVDALGLFGSISSEINWNTSARVLTDQYSPANLLKER